MNKYKLVIFDMDGTLADTSPGILNCIRYTQEKMALPQITLEQMYSHVGPPMHESYNRNFGLTGEELDKAVSYHKEYAMNKGYKELEFYEGIEQLLIWLRKNGIMTAVATLKAHSTAEKILETYDMAKYFDIVIGVDAANPMTKSQLLDYCTEKSGIAKSEAVLIGDSEYDAIGAEESGISFIAVTYGFGFKNEADTSGHPCVAVCKSVSDIENVLS